MIKQEFVDRIAQETGMTKAQALEAVNAFHATLLLGLKKDGFVKIQGMGQFRIRVYSPRMGRDPRNGKIIHIKKRKRVTFTASPAMHKEIA